MKSVGKTIVFRNGKTSVEDWPEIHTMKDGSIAKFSKAPGSAIIGDVAEPMTIEFGDEEIKIKIG